MNLLIAEWMFKVCLLGHPLYTWESGHKDNNIHSPTFKKNREEKSFHELSNQLWHTNRFRYGVYLWLNQKFYDKSIQNIFISWLKNPSNLEKKKKKVISQTLGKLQVICSHLNTLTNSALTTKCIFASLCDKPLNQHTFWGGLALSLLLKSAPQKPSRRLRRALEEADSSA